MSTSSRLPVVPYVAHTSRALSFYNLDIYLALGKTTPWSSTELESGFIPPKPELTSSGIEELLGMKRTRKLLVKPDATGSITWQGSKWKVLSEEEAIQQQSRWVYLEAIIQSGDMALTPYRQVALFSRITRKPGVSAEKEILLPDEIVSLGVLEMLDNRPVVVRQADTKDTYTVIIEF